MLFDLEIATSALRTVPMETIKMKIAEKIFFDDKNMVLLFLSEIMKHTLILSESSFKIVNECSVLYNNVSGNYHVKAARSALEETQRKSHNRLEPRTARPLSDANKLHTGVRA